ncbi:MAG TPA: hypothetical protein VD963_11295 [Phycisphaerales bacterium]|nr:hypothetical protein [Phycisphaerales bacterium]
MDHALVLGGTGMLAGVCLGLADRGCAVSVVARGHARLAALARRSAGLAGPINPVPVDYHDHGALAAGIRAAGMAHGPVRLVVAWVRSSATGTLELVCDLVASERAPRDVLHVRSSAAADPMDRATARSQALALERLPGVRYRQVVLGFVHEQGSARWLTDAEIAAGVLGALDSGASLTVVGTVRPWSARPGAGAAPTG